MSLFRKQIAFVYGMRNKNSTKYMSESGGPKCRKRFVDASQQAVSWKLAHGEIIYSW